MTAPREFPNNAKDARDEAANLVNSALIRLDKLRTTDVDIISAKFELSEALRWLERIGAPTQPIHKT